MRLRKRKWMEKLLSERKEIFFEEEELELAINHDENKPFVIEIGSGKGGFIALMAQRHPNETYLGIEMQRSAMAIAVKNIEKDSLPNLKLLCIDALKVFEHLKDNSVDTIFLNFSDPWLKKRQHKRRLTYPTFLNEYLRILKKDGQLIFKTDNEDLFNDSLKYIMESKFILVSSTNDYDGKDCYDAPTEYETKFRMVNTPIHRLVARKE